MKKNNNNTKRNLTKTPTNFHDVPKFLPFFAMTIQIPKPLENHHQQKNGENPPTHPHTSSPILHSILRTPIIFL
jgi:hypothetical protein